MQREKIKLIKILRPEAVIYLEFRKMKKKHINGIQESRRNAGYVLGLGNQVKKHFRAGER